VHLNNKHRFKDRFHKVSPINLGAKMVDSKIEKSQIVERGFRE